MLGVCVAMLLWATPLLAAGPDGRAPRPDIGRSIPVQGPRQIFNDDLKVESGQVIENDAMVYSGNVEVEEGGRINGDLFVFSGNIEIEEGGAVDGDVVNYSGNVSVAGFVGGDISALSGNVDLESSARVEGDISVVSGNIRRDEGASVGGNVVQGPTFRFPGSFGPGAPDVPSPGISFARQPNTLVGTVLGFIGRLVAAALMTLLAMLLVGAVYYGRPQLITDTRRQLESQLALSAVVGGLANLTVIFLAGLLAVTICLLPLALIPLLVLFAVNVIGWAVISQIVGEKIVAFAKQEVQPVVTLLVGTFFASGILALLWALGGCFQFVAWLLLFAASSLGTGAALLPWINRRRGFGGSGDGGGDVPPASPAPRGPSGADVETDVAAPIDYVTAEEINAGARGGQAATAASTAEAPVQSADLAGREVVEHDVAQPLDHVTAEEINATAEQAPKPARQRSTRRAQASTPDQQPAAEGQQAGDRNQIVEQDVAAPLDHVTAQEINTTEALAEGDDFLQIRGIGPTYARRLKEAGFSTFAQLAVATPEAVAEAIGWPVDRVRRSELIDQAKVLAAQ